MKLLTLRYGGDCAKCGATLAAGATAGYERGCGIYCPPCMPSDPEEIRELRQARNDRKADRRESWAQARQRRADAAQARSDSQRAWTEQQAANEHRAKAAALRRPVLVAGDTARARKAANAEARARLTAGGLKVGSTIIAHPFPVERAVLRVNRETVSFATSYGTDKTDFRSVELVRV